MSNELNERTFRFAVSTLKLLKKIPDRAEYNVIRYQLAKSSSSIGAIYEESQSGGSLADFTHKIRIALREARESNYWLRLLQEVHQSYELNDEVCKLIEESYQLRKILATILNKTGNR